MLQSKESEEDVQNIVLPIIHTKQAPGGCVTASARNVLTPIGIDFENDFSPKLQEYCLDPNNHENAHMLSIAVIAAGLGLQVAVHKSNPWQYDVLPNDALERAKKCIRKYLKNYGN